MATTEIFCPTCGKKVKIKTKENRYTGFYEGEGICPNCKTPIFYEDRRSVDQEGTVEVVFH